MFCSVNSSAQAPAGTRRAREPHAAAQLDTATEARSAYAAGTHLPMAPLKHTPHGAQPEAAQEGRVKSALLTERGGLASPLAAGRRARLRD